MRFVGTIFSVAITAFAVYIAWTLYREYSKQDASLSRWSRLIEAARSSQTILWNKFIYIVAGIVAQLDNLADFFNMPQAKDFINQWFTPKTVAAVMLGIAFVSIRARLRPGTKDPL